MIHKVLAFTSLFFILFQNSIEPVNIYSREFYENGILKAEGWKNGTLKENYWYFYYPNQNISKKGHYLHDSQEGYWFFFEKDNVLAKEGNFEDGVENGWWIFYNGDITKKMFFKNGEKEGFALIYKNNKLKKAEKYSNNLKTGEWTSLIKFKYDNPEVPF